MLLTKANIATISLPAGKKDIIVFDDDINGFGLLGLTSIVDRDYPVVMGVVFLASVLLLIGNILSDILVALVDPRIRFN